MYCAVVAEVSTPPFIDTTTRTAAAAEEEGGRLLLLFMMLADEEEVASEFAASSAEEVVATATATQGWRGSEQCSAVEFKMMAGTAQPLTRQAAYLRRSKGSHCQVRKESSEGSGGHVRGLL